MILPAWNTNSPACSKPTKKKVALKSYHLIVAEFIKIVFSHDQYGCHVK